MVLNISHCDLEGDDSLGAHGRLVERGKPLGVVPVEHHSDSAKVTPTLSCTHMQTKTHIHTDKVCKKVP